MPMTTSGFEVSKLKPPSIAVGYSRLMARQLHLQGKELEILLQGSGLSVRELMDDATLLTNSQQLQIMHNAMAYSGNPAFGLQMGRALTPPTHGPLGFLASSSPNLETAIQDFLSFIPARVNIFSCKTELANGQLECYFDVDIEGNPHLYRCMAECFFLALIALIEFVVGAEFTEGRISCNYPKPAYFEEYEKAIRCPIAFDASTNMLSVPEKLLLTANVSSDFQSYDFALKQCRRMQDELDDSECPMTHMVKKQLLSHPPGRLSEDMVSQQNFISKRTLARRLEAENSSFRELRDELLMTLATDYLRDTAHSVESISLMLNYHDSSSFRRAFKRWTGKTPQQYRKSALG